MKQPENPEVSGWKYMDVKSDLIPLSIVYNNKFVRMGQIYLEGSGKWNEDLFEIPLAGD